MESNITAEIASKNPELGPEALGGEVFSTLFGLHNQGKLIGESSMDVWNRITILASESESIMDFLKKAVNSIFNSNVDVDIEAGDTLMSIIDKVGNDIVYGEGSIMNSLTEATKEELAYINNPIEVEADIESKLKELNKIKRICV